MTSRTSQSPVKTEQYYSVHPLVLHRIQRSESQHGVPQQSWLSWTALAKWKTRVPIAPKNGLQAALLVDALTNVRRSVAQKQSGTQLVVLLAILLMM